MRGHPDFEFLLRRQEQLNASNRDRALAAPGSTRVLVAESNRLVAEALMLAIDVEPTLEPIGYALDGWEAIELTGSLGPDVIVIGAKLAGLDAFTLTGLLKDFWPSVSTIRLTDWRSSAADGCVSLDRSADELIDAITAAAAQNTFPVSARSYAQPERSYV
jgi:DNA-binding NarL/FixJ family response regulator